MSEGILRTAASGEIVGLRGVVTIPQIAVAASSTGSGSFTFSGAEVGDSVTVNARAALGNVNAPQAFVASADHITLIFATGGAALTVSPTTAPISADVSLGQW
jgi:hypothetical protein